MDLPAFHHLHELLKDFLNVDEKMANVRRGGTKSDLISTESRLGACLLLLAGGREI